MGEEIRLEQAVAAPGVRVWEALIRPGLWWGEGVQLEPQVGGTFVKPWRDADGDHLTFGTVTGIEAPHRLEMSWKDEAWTFETAVAFTIAEADGETLVTLRHHGWTAAPAADRERLLAEHHSGWRRHLKSLAACAEGLQD